MEEIPTLSEFQFLTDTWPDNKGVCYLATGEICLENGWIDDFGFVTPEGKRAIEAYEERNKE